MVGGVGVLTYQYQQVAQGQLCEEEGYNGIWIDVGIPISDAIGADGDHTLCVKGRDLVGNTQTVATTHSWQQDTTGPHNAAITIGNNLSVYDRGVGC